MPATCVDGTRNGAETDKDCGGSCPNKCADALGCVAGSDCVNGVCDMAAKTCSAPTCTDTVKNGTETDVDCGGSCATAMPPVKCATGLKCMVDGDCIGSVCMGGTCQSCTDKVKNQDETDVDCGGVTCGKCGGGKVCLLPSDCTSGVCTGGKCQPASCSDSVMNGTETDIDCGGGCNSCPSGKKCLLGTDCTSNVCQPGDGGKFCM